VIKAFFTLISISYYIKEKPLFLSMQSPLPHRNKFTKERGFNNFRKFGVGFLLHRSVNKIGA